jgi:hypothetical protein
MKSVGKMRNEGGRSNLIPRNGGGTTEMKQEPEWM